MLQSLRSETTFMLSMRSSGKCLLLALCCCTVSLSFERSDIYPDVNRRHMAGSEAHTHTEISLV